MTKLVLFSSENIAKAKGEITSLAKEFLKAEPGNTMVIPETRQGMAIFNQAFAKLEAMGYSPEDAQLLLSEVVEKLHKGDTDSPRSPSGSGGFRDDNF